MPLAGTWPATQPCALTGNQTGDLSVHRPALNPWSPTSQGSIPYFLKGDVSFIIFKIDTEKLSLSNIFILLEKNCYELFM